LEAVEAYRGWFFDLDQGLKIGPAPWARARRSLAAAMVGQGLDPGDRVVMAIGNGPRFVAVLAAILAGGGSPLLLHAETPLEEIKRTAARYAARFAAVDALDEGQLLAGHLDPRALGDDWARIVWARTPAAARSAPPPRFLPGVPLHPTSGTTGEPKIAARPGPCALAEAAHYIETIGIDAGDLLLVAPPMSHAYAYGMGVMVPLLSGANVATMRRFSPRLVQDALQLGVTIFPAVPMMLDLLLFGTRRLHGGVGCVLTAGSPLPERTARDFRQRFGIAVRPLYGTTETGGISVAPADSAARSADAIGPPMRGVSVEIRGAGPGAELGDGVGILHVRSSSMMAGYVQDGRLDESWIDRGWFSTGDLARWDAAGNIRLLGRQADVINVGGMKVVPSEVEEVLALLPGVVQVKVYAGARRNGAQFVKAAIVADPAIDVAAVRAHCEKHLVYFKRPDTILFVEALPKSAAGKILTRQLP
jgi:acyl-coenzyme A synthetase/AMP-(fatty) acid ligase